MHLPVRFSVVQCYNDAMIQYVFRYVNSDGMKIW